MPKQALYLKWRPTTFDDMVGQEHITRTLRNSLKTGRIRHAYLFSGPRGTGKTTSARLLAVDAEAYWRVGGHCTAAHDPQGESGLVQAMRRTGGSLGSSRGRY